MGIVILHKDRSFENKTTEVAERKRMNSHGIHEGANGIELAIVSVFWNRNRIIEWGVLCVDNINNIEGNSAE